MRRSDDLGQTWEETPNGAIRFPEDTGVALARVWQLVPGVEDGVVWAGTEPGAIFRSTDRGETFELVRGLWDHPHRDGVERRASAVRPSTRSCPTPPTRSSVLAAISTGGVYRTADGGDSWEASNTGVKAEFMPGERFYPEFGQCVHKVARDSGRQRPALPAEPRRRLPLRRRRQELAGHRAGPAERVRLRDRHPPADPGHRLHLPDQLTRASAGRSTATHGCGVRPTRGSPGRSWGASDLPDGYFAAVMRDAMCTDQHDPAGLYFGGRNGAVWASPDEGESWAEVAEGLPDVMVVRAAALT